MKNKIFTVFSLLIFSGSSLSQSQQSPYFHKWEKKHTLGEQPQRRYQIFNQPPYSMNTPAHQKFYRDKVKELHAIIPDFQVNENVGPNGAHQESASISTDDSGNFVITWADRRNVDYDIYAQRYASDGNALGTNFRVNDDPGSADQVYPSISTDGSGNFVITWVDDRNGDWDIYAQRYSSDGSPLGTNFKVNDQGSVDPWYFSSSTDNRGNFVITWGDYRNGDLDIYAQRYASDGSALGTNFRVNDQGSADQGSPSVSTDDSGNFVITWDDVRNGDFDIYAQRYSSDGSPLGTNFKVNDDIGSVFQWWASPSIDDSGTFVITWLDGRNGDPDIYAQNYSSDGSALGNNFKVNDDIGSAWQWKPCISTDGGGDFVITWNDDRNGNWDIYTQCYASDGSPLGTNFKVNDDSGSASQWYPSISTDDSGNFMITWMGDRNGDWDIYAQRYSSDGSALGINFKINDDRGSADQSHPSISTDSSANFVITWVDGRNGDSDIYAQRYLSDGNTLGTNFKVNDDLGSALQGYPSITTDDMGNFVITWVDDRNGDWDIYAQRYASDGSASSTNFKVNDNNQGRVDQWYHSISIDDSGNFVITWMDDRNGVGDIYAQRYSSDGSTSGTNFKVNDEPGDSGQGSPSISTDDGGNFVITWDDERNGDLDIYAQRYSSDGSPLGTNFIVNDNTGIADQTTPSISTESSGNFVITWDDERNGDLDIYAQRFSSNGSTLGTNFKVNDQGSVAPWYHSISTDGSGNFIITWTDNRNGDPDIYAQRYNSDGSALGTNFRVTNTSEKYQNRPDVKLWNGRIYTTWTDNRAGATGYDIWANVLDWDNPIGTTERELSQIPSSFTLNQNYPNPFNPATTIEFSIPKTEFVTLKIYNILGEEVATLVSDKLVAGSYMYEWNASNLASGVYLYRLEAVEFVETKKLVLLR